jgi:hypothetical protein
MVCVGSDHVSTQGLKAFVQEALEPGEPIGEALESFRAMSWLHRSSGGDVGFRHQALTVICAAQHISWALARRDRLSLGNWNAAVPLADLVAGHTGALLDADAVLGGAALLDGSVPVHVHGLICQVLRGARVPTRNREWQPAYEAGVWASILKGLASEPADSLVGVRLLIERLEGGRLVQICLPLLWKLSRGGAEGAVGGAREIVDRLRRWHPKGSFEDLLHTVRSDRETLVDHLLLRNLGVAAQDVLATESYYGAFHAIRDSLAVSQVELSKYVERSLAAFEGHRRRTEAVVGQPKAPSKKRPRWRG